jgi:hypothetical protein
MPGKASKRDLIATDPLNFPFLRTESRYFPNPPKECGVLAQLVERLNGIEEVRGSNPLGSMLFKLNNLRLTLASWISL